MRAPLKVHRWRDEKNGAKGVSIQDADGRFIANMVAQLDDTEVENAAVMVARFNEAEAGVKQMEIGL